MSYIHAKGIIHRDLNSRNILLTDQGHAKVMRTAQRRVLQTHGIACIPRYFLP
jgi:serine/threonine protein kinase